LTYPALGLCGEAGECAEKVKKAIRDDGGALTEERRAALAAELGDVLWYMAQLATEAGLDLDAIAEDNLAKLLSRTIECVLPSIARWNVSATMRAPTPFSRPLFSSASRST